MRSGIRVKYKGKVYRTGRVYGANVELHDVNTGVFVQVAASWDLDEEAPTKPLPRG